MVHCEWSNKRPPLVGTRVTRLVEYRVIAIAVSAVTTKSSTKAVLKVVFDSYRRVRVPCATAAVVRRQADIS